MPGRQRPEWSLLGLLALSISISAAAACSPTISTLQPARTTPDGHLQLTTSFDLVDTSGAVRDTLENARDMDIGGTVDRGELTEIIEAGSVALVQPPSIGYQLSAAYGLSERFEIGLRTSVSALRAHVRFQWLRIAPGIYGSLAAGVSGYLFGLPLQTFSDDITLDGFLRFDFDFPLHLGYSGRYFHVWGGPKLILSTYGADMTVCTDSRTGNCRRDAAVHLGGTAAYVTGQLGLAVGYRRFWVAAELSIGRVGMSGDVGVNHSGVETTGTVAKEGLVVAPSFGLIFWI